MKRHYRTDGSAEPGKDYVCSKCRARGLRLWRQAHTMLDNVRLLCADCATASQTAQIATYAHFHQEHETTIGDLVPARPTPEGDTFWGHTAGDVEWWYALPQYLDAKRETALVLRERDNFVQREQAALADYLRLHQRLAEAERGRTQAPEVTHDR